MAQLYKMTVYVCDLEENLSLDEIKCLIEDRALDGVAVSCVTHFANEKVGAHVDWDDDIDINYTDSTTEQWERYFDSPYSDPVVAAGGCYCQECSRPVEDGGYLWCGGNVVNPTDFCSHGKPKTNH